MTKWQGSAGIAYSFGLRSRVCARCEICEMCVEYAWSTGARATGDAHIHPYSHASY